MSRWEYIETSEAGIACGTIGMDIYISEGFHVDICTEPIPYLIYPTKSLNVLSLKRDPFFFLPPVILLLL